MKKCIYKIILVWSILLFIPLCIYADDKLIMEDFYFKNSSIPTLSSISEVPKINARHALIFDRNSKIPIYGKKEKEKCKMASTTKIMTAIVVIENSQLDDIVKISQKSAGTGGSRLGLSKNDKISVKHLLYGLMLKSGNDAAVALAEYTGGNVENFALMMNKKAKILNLTQTNFVTPHGLDDENHYTTALDLAILSDYALSNNIFSKIVKTKSYTISINNHPKTISNTNELLGNFEGLYGIKTGFTNGANRCLITACKRDSLDFICVVLGCDTKKNRTQDSINLLNYAFNNYSLINVENLIYEKFDNWFESHTCSFFINKGKTQNIDLYLEKSDFIFSNIAIKNSIKNKINIEIIFNSYFDAPVKMNTHIGNIILLIDNKRYYSVDILSNSTIYKKSPYDYISFILKNYPSFFKKNSTIL